jgi:Zn finger protein HypA/HybF involved in hydrogenase expression
MHSVRIKVQVGVVLCCCLGVAVWAGYVFRARAQGPVLSSGGGPAGATTWRPVGKDAKYVGADACAKCHAKESATQHTTPMGRALEPVAAGDILRKYPRLTFRSDPLTYQITRQGDRSIYSVTDGRTTVSEPILYAFGQGKAGQTYVFQHNGSFYESRLSFYKEIQGLDWTIGYERKPPAALDEALGRAISADEARTCFTCHATAATNGAQLQLDRLIPGVSCEACHGPGGPHVAAMAAQDYEHTRIFNPRRMSPDELSQEFCGSCHRSAEQVMSNKTLQGLHSVRFQPYRIFVSRGHDPFDPRLSCTACHEPHTEPRHDQAYYDAKCFACHQSTAPPKGTGATKDKLEGERTAKPCPVSQQACASCHMPKIELPGAHFKFTDHRIRTVRPGAPFPN